MTLPEFAEQLNHVSDHQGCEAMWVTQPDGVEQACDAPATRVVQFEDDTLLVCPQCAADLSDFDLYHVERSLQGPREALESWTGKPE